MVQAETLPTQNSLHVKPWPQRHRQHPSCKEDVQRKSPEDEAGTPAHRWFTCSAWRGSPLGGCCKGGRGKKAAPIFTEIFFCAHDRNALRSFPPQNFRDFVDVIPKPTSTPSRGDSACNSYLHKFIMKTMHCNAIN